MKPILALITGIQLLVHSVFGCCAHHTAAGQVHVTAAGCCSQLTRTCGHLHRQSKPRAQSGAQSLAKNGSQTPDSSGQAPHQCVHDGCHWIITKTCVKASLSNLLLAALTTLPDDVTAANLSLRSSEHVGGCFLAAPCSLRSHLRLSVLRV